ncbi:hypothetical protein DPX16_21372 [Anabarilius grahami]|uniref:Uncharacterized protein n=1 Tax=Anabarilius grahami TaxID=495550 RepID=A0A3N0XFP0_ANAGA|nr:hypothetical protein DPX16_21372 [Anabarilius grahami]
MLHNLDSDDSDAGALSEVESDSDLSWVQDNSSSSSESESESVKRKKRLLSSSEIREPDVPFTADVPVKALVMVARPAARRLGRASPEMVQGCKLLSAVGLEDWLSSVMMEVTRDWT